MKRQERDHRPRFVTFSYYRRLPLLRNPRIAAIVPEALAQARERWGVRVCAWVMMAEHVHALLFPAPGEGLEPALRSAKIIVSRRVLMCWRELGAPILNRIKDSRGSPRFWQPGGGFDRNVRGDDELSRAIRYIHRNPVERGLVERPEDWKWSSVRWWMGQRESDFECDYPPGNWDRWRGFA